MRQPVLAQPSTCRDCRDSDPFQNGRNQQTVLRERKRKRNDRPFYKREAFSNFVSDFVYCARVPRLRNVLTSPQLLRPARMIDFDCTRNGQYSAGLIKFDKKEGSQVAIISAINSLSLLVGKLTPQEPPTMADRHNEAPQAPAFPPQPPNAFYALDAGQESEMRLTNYRNTTPLGVYLAPHPTTANVVTTPTGDCVHLNEPNNLYAKKLLTKIIYHMRARQENRAAENEDNDDDDEVPTPRRAGNRIGERRSMDAIMNHEAERLIDLGNYTPEPITQRRRQVYRLVLCGFTTETYTNETLDQILVNFVRIRLGDFPKDCDELGAAVWAVKMFYDDVVPDSNESGRGLWTLPVVHLLNGHMIHRGMFPLAFHQDGDRDEQIGNNERAAHSDTIWIEGERAKVENREVVITQFRDFATEMGITIDEIEDEGPPEEPDAQGPPAQRRRILHLG